MCHAGRPAQGGRPSRVWFSFDLAKVATLALKSAVWRRFHATACLDCDAWMRRHDHAVRRDGSLELIDVEPGVKSLPATAYSDDSTRSITPQFARLVKAPRELHERPLDGECQLGGDPAWVQDPVDVHCGRCKEAMTFVFRLSAPQPFVGFPIIAGDSGALYYFVCRTCPRSTHLAQWT